MYLVQEVRGEVCCEDKDLISKSNLLVFFGMFIASSWCFERRVDGSIKGLKLPSENLPKDYFFNLSSNLPVQCMVSPKEIKSAVSE